MKCRNPPIVLPVFVATSDGKYFTLRVMNDVAWHHQQFRTKYLYLIYCYWSRFLLYGPYIPVYTARRARRPVFLTPVCTGVKNAPVYTGRIYGRSVHTTCIYGPYSRKALRTMLFFVRAVYTGDRYALPVHTARTYGPYVRVSKMHPYIRAVNTARIYGCSVHTTRIELLFCTGRIYGSYIRVTGTHYP